jgi:hypothetical protein
MTLLIVTAAAVLIPCGVGLVVVLGWERWFEGGAAIRTADGWLHSDDMTREELRASYIRDLEQELGIR